MKKRWISVLAAVCLLLGACSAKPDDLKKQAEQGQEITENETQTELRLNPIELPDADIALTDIIPEGGRSYGVKWGVAGENVYRLVHISSSSDECPTDAGFCVQVLKPPYTDWENHLITPEDWVEGKSFQPWIWTFAEYFSGDGVLHMLLKDQEGASSVGRWSLEECSVTVLEGEGVQEEFFNDKVPEIWSTGEEFGNYFLYMQQNQDMEYQYHALWLDKDGQEKSGMPQPSEGCVCQVEVNPFSGAAYMFGLPAGGIVEGAGGAVSFDGFAIWKEGEANPVFTSWDAAMTPINKAVFCSETEGYLCNGSEVWKFSLEEQSMKEIFHAGDLELFHKMLTCHGVSVREDGSLLMLSEGMYNAEGKGTCFLWELSEQAVQEDKEKKELVLAVTTDSSYKQLVWDFNMQSEDYRIVLRTAKQGEDFEDYRTQLQAEMAAGGGPDLLVTGQAVNLESAARKGYLLDLTEYLEGYEEELLPAAWKTGQVDGKLYALPHACGINTLVVSQDAAGDRGSWTLQEAMQCMEESNALFFAGMDGEGALFYYLGLSTESNKNLVDWENGVSSLKSGEAEALLEFTVKYTDLDSTYANSARRISEGEGLAFLQYLYNVNAMKLAAAVFRNEEAYIGFPAEDGGERTPDVWIGHCGEPCM